MRRLLAIGAVAATVAVAVAGTHIASRAKATPDVSAYEGLGTWVSIFGAKAYSQPDAVAAAIAARGVKTVYVQTGNFSQPTDVVKPDQLGAFVDALHAAGLRAVAWYLPGFVKPAVDLRRAVAAVQFKTPQGGSFDGFALDIESSAVKRVGLRTSRVLALSRQLRDAVGTNYALGAIIPSPRGMELVPRYWPGFPYADLAKLYDVFLPMGYYTFHVHGASRVYRETRANVRILRSHPGCADVAVHIIGGIAQDTSSAEVRQFVRASNESGCIGASLYSWSGTRPSLWTQLASVASTAAP